MVDQQLSVIFTLHFRNRKESRQYKGHLCHIKYMWILFKYFCEFLKPVKGNVTFGIYDLAHFHLLTLLTNSKHNLFQPWNCWNVLRRSLPLWHEKYDVSLVNWFYNVIVMQIRHGCSCLGHDCTKFEDSGTKPSQTSSWLLIGLLGIRKPWPSAPRMQPAAYPAHCELEASLAYVWEKAR